MGLIVEREAFRHLRDSLDETARLVFTNGCFDLLHVGHIAVLNFARSLGDVLVVGLNSDASARRLKGPARPLIPQDERARTLAALAAVTFVIIFEEDDPIETLRAVRPQVHVKGGDYRLDQIPERRAVEEMGAEVVIGPYIEGQSTTTVAESLRPRLNPPPDDDT